MSTPEPTPAEREDIDEVKKRDMPGNPTGPDHPAAPGDGPEKKIQEPTRPATPRQA